MKKILFLFIHLFIAISIVEARLIEVSLGNFVNVDDTYSFRNFTNNSIIDLNIDLSSRVIYASSFYNESPNSVIFPTKMTGVIFIRCNLDNVVIPTGNVLIDCSNKSIKVQNDLEDWIIDKSGNPIEPVSKEKFEILKISTSPADIPIVKLEKSITQTALEEKAKQKEIAIQEAIKNLEALP